MTLLAWANVEQVGADGVLRAKAGPVEVVRAADRGSPVGGADRVRRMGGGRPASPGTHVHRSPP